MSEQLTREYVDTAFSEFRNTLPTGEVLFSAGFPSYEANFTRDTLLAGIISSHTELLESQLYMCARNQGTKHNPVTGEKPGATHHELPGATLDGRKGMTTYNACDTTALFVIGAEILTELDSMAYEQFQQTHAENLERAAGYLVDHVGDDDLFWERPPEGATGFALHVTMWKDSILPHPEGKLEPDYPVSYALAHFMAARGLLGASSILGQPDLAVKADAMFQAGISQFMRPDNFVVYRDSTEELHQASSDEMHSLAYIPTEYASLLPLRAIRERAKQYLETPIGYRCTPYQVAQTLADKYHGDKVWVFDQAMIHHGTQKFDMGEEAMVAARIAPHIGDGQELFGLEMVDGVLHIIPEGNPRQLWSVAAREYLAGRTPLRASMKL
jgi:hypothetical protein